MPIRLSRRHFIHGATLLPLLGWQEPAEAEPWEEAPKPGVEDWQAILNYARDFVSRETPNGAFPFGPNGATDPQKKVFAHYFPPYPLSIDNKNIAEDYYTAEYLNRAGENGKYSRVGGLLRERPIGNGHIDSPFWRHINYAIEIMRAETIGLDGFGVDLVQLRKGRYWSAVRMLVDTAAAVAPNFRILLEPDCGILKAMTPSELADEVFDLAKYLTSYRLSDGRLVVAPFAPDNRPLQFWIEFLDIMEARGESVALLPILLDHQRYLAVFAPISYGLSSWGSRDPDDRSLRDMGETRSDGIKIWMMPIVPQDVRPKSPSFWETQNTRLFNNQWKQAIQENYQYAHLITWNDFSETTEISPGTKTQFLFYDLTRYYALWFKTGRPPLIWRDAIYYCHRNQIIADGHSPVLGQAAMRLHGKFVSNKVEMIAFLVEPATLEINLSGISRTIDVPAGLATFWVDAAPGTPIFAIKRNNKLILETRSMWEISANPTQDDHTYRGGSSKRETQQ